MVHRGAQCGLAARHHADVPHRSDLLRRLQPHLAPGNDTTPDKGLLGSWLPTWPAGPSWLYWVTQGVHVTLSLVLIPIVLAKLWSVLPKLFEWPSARSITHLVERASLLLLVGGAVFELVTV